MSDTPLSLLKNITHAVQYRLIYAAGIARRFSIHSFRPELCHR